MNIWGAALLPITQREKPDNVQENKDETPLRGKRRLSLDVSTTMLTNLCRGYDFFRAMRTLFQCGHFYLLSGGGSITRESNAPPREVFA